jgi:hypothetical protein
MDLSISIHPMLVVAIITAFIALRIMRFEKRGTRMRKVIRK